MVLTWTVVARPCACTGMSSQYRGLYHCYYLPWPFHGLSWQCHEHAMAYIWSLQSRDLPWENHDIGHCHGNSMVAHPCCFHYASMATPCILHGNAISVIGNQCHHGISMHNFTMESPWIVPYGNIDGITTGFSMPIPWVNAMVAPPIHPTVGDESISLSSGVIFCHWDRLNFSSEQLHTGYNDKFVCT